ncbi:MAG TPA: hypothetical protein VIM56_06135 [Rhizomicrobium sp.]
MFEVDPAIVTALGKRELYARFLVSVVAKDFDSGEEVAGRFWNDVSVSEIAYIDGDTRETTTGDFTGLGDALKVDDILLTSTIEVRTLNITLDGVNDQVRDLIRGYDLRNAPVQVHLAVFDPNTHDLVAAAIPVFMGFVDGNPIEAPAVPLEGGAAEGSVTWSCVSHSRELTRASAEKASDASQRLRNPDDAFFQDVDVIADWEIQWGLKKGRVVPPPAKPTIPGLIGAAIALASG